MMPRSFQCLDAHAGGALVRVLVSGVPPLHAETLAGHRRCLVEQHPDVWQPLVRPPRAPAGAVLAVLVEPHDPAAHVGLVFVHPDGNARFSGSGLIAAVTVALERQLLMTRDLVTGRGSLFVETEAGLVPVRVEQSTASAAGVIEVESVAYCANGVRVCAAGLAVSVGHRTLRADLVDAGGLVAVVDAEAAGVPLGGVHLAALARLGHDLCASLDAMRPAAWPDVVGVAFTGPPTGPGDVRALVVDTTGTLDPGPSGRAAAALLCVFDAMGLVEPGQRLVIEGLSGTTLTASVVRADGDEPGDRRVDVEVEGRAWIVADSTALIEADDPLAHGLSPAPRGRVTPPDGVRS